MLADDHTIFREGLRSLLADEHDMTVVGQTSGGAELLESLDRTRPDLVIMDIAMPGMSGVQATRLIKAQHPGIRVLILSMSGDESTVREAVRAGADGYLVKETAASELLTAIRSTADGEAFFSASIAGYRERRPDRNPANPADQELTPREREVLLLIATSKTNKEIAALLDISHKTVDAHRQHIMTKLDIHDVAGLTRYAIAQGLVK
jgi:DNA-binding NarL/FixJ family response regulator